MHKAYYGISGKETYESISIEVIGFSSEDIITNSCVPEDEGITTGNDSLICSANS